jgi:hypothetical protein
MRVGNLAKNVLAMVSVRFDIPFDDGLQHLLTLTVEYGKPIQIIGDASWLKLDFPVNSQRLCKAVFFSADSEEWARCLPSAYAHAAPLVVRVVADSEGALASPPLASAQQETPRETPREIPRETPASQRSLPERVIWKKMTWVLILWCAIIAGWLITRVHANHCSMQHGSWFLGQQASRDACRIGARFNIGVMIMVGVAGFVILSLLWLIAPRRKPETITADDDQRTLSGVGAE